MGRLNRRLRAGRRSGDNPRLESERARLEYVNLGDMLRAAAQRGDMREVERLIVEVNRAYRRFTR